MAMFDPQEIGSIDAGTGQARGPFWLGTEYSFPPAQLAGEHGLLAIGGDLEPERVLAAYRAGVFPWPLAGDGLPMMWWSPDPRCILPLDELRVSRSLRRTLRKGHLGVSFDRDFDAVIESCATIERPGQEGTWINDSMLAAYRQLHRLGFAHSVETRDRRDGGRLVGGLYGVALGGVFFGESMFSQVADASKVAVCRLVEQLRLWSYDFIDCQQETEHMARLGARSIPIERFVLELRQSMGKPDRAGSWEQD